MSNKALQTFDFNDKTVRVIMRDGEPWWVARDVCDVLELVDVTSALRAVVKLIIIQIIRDSPYTFVTPAVSVFPITVIRRQIAPWCPSSQYPKYSVDKITCFAAR